MENNIYDFVKKQSSKYEKTIELEEGWDWSMKDHLKKSFLYKHSQFIDHNEDRTLRPNKNIVRGILNVQYRTEGFDVKDIELYIDDPDEYYKSFLVKKYHDKWALENSMDTFIDELVESYCDYGGALVKNVGEVRPEVVDLRDISFCNQTDLLNYPFGFKRSYSQADLRKAQKEQGWGEDANGATMNVEELIVLNKDEEADEIEVYEIYGTLPKEWLDKKDEVSEIDTENEDEMQFQVIAYYKDSNNDKHGVTLYKTRIPDLSKIFKMLKRDDIKGRALGWGGVEELFEPQKWTNWNEIKTVELLEASSKVILLTDNTKVASKNKKGLKNMENLELIEVSPESKGVWQLDNSPRAWQLFDKAMTNWEEHAQQIGSATDPLQGETPPSGTPFKLYERQTLEAKGMHNYRRGKIAVFVDEVYRDWVLPHITRQIAKGDRFLEELSADEMMAVSKKFVKHYANRILVEKVLQGMPINAGTKEQMEMEAEQEFLKSNKKFIEILKDEFKGKPIGVRTNIAGKQKNLDLMTDKLVGVMREWMQMRSNGVDTTGLDNIINTILESSGLSPVMFGYNPGQPQLQNATTTQGQAQNNIGGQGNGAGTLSTLSGGGGKEQA